MRNHQSRRLLATAILLATTFNSRAVCAQQPPAAPHPLAPRAQAPPPRQAQGPPARQPQVPQRQVPQQQGAQQPQVPAPAGAAGKPPMRPPGPPAPPFQLTAEQLHLLDTVLKNWEDKNSRTKTFKCKFSRWDYDQAFGSQKNEWLKAKCSGEICYKSPDKGKFRVTEMDDWDQAKQEFAKVTDGLDHWVCDGKAIYQFVPADKQLKVHEVPAEMQGEAIADGPVPFIFGAKAAKLKLRYWMRDVTPRQEVGKRTWIEALPRFQHDAANFSRAVFVLNDADFQPHSLKLELPGGKQSNVYLFENIVINDLLEKFKADFAAPTAPRGWKKVVIPADEPDEKPADPAGKGEQARKPPAPTKTR